VGEVGKTGDRALLRLGAQLAEVEALFACVLDTPDAQAERRALRELAGAGSRLAELAGALAGGQAPPEPPRRSPARRRAAGTRRPARTRLERRIARVQVTTEWIITHAGGRTGGGVR
jgi:plasmid stabilization system protein ParE